MHIFNWLLVCGCVVAARRRLRTMDLPIGVREVMSAKTGWGPSAINDVNGRALALGSPGMNDNSSLLDGRGNYLINFPDAFKASILHRFLAFRARGWLGCLSNGRWLARLGEVHNLLEPLIKECNITMCPFCGSVLRIVDASLYNFYSLHSFRFSAVVVVFVVGNCPLMRISDEFNCMPIRSIACYINYWFLIA